MGLLDISFRRPINSYSKVQSVFSWLRRGRRFQLSSPRVTAKEYLDVGCGPNTHDGFINLEYRWHPKVDLCWDVSKGIPLKDSSLKGIFTEHCLEHFSLPKVRFLLQEFRRLLRPGGTARVVVPDAGLYIDIYQRKMAGDRSASFPWEIFDRDASGGLTAPLVSVNRIFYLDRDSPAGHRCMFDEVLLTELMTTAGFQNVRRASFRVGRDPFLLIDTETRAIESLYLEGSVS